MAVNRSRAIRILYVEDSEDDVKLSLRALRSGGFEPAYRRVQTAANFAAALADGGWDAVIADYSMPGFTGLDALRIFKSTGIDIPFLLVSGTIGEEFAADAMKAGASDYVMKANLARLAPALERELKEAQARAARYQAERDLVDSERRLRTIFETEPECVKVVSREGKLLDMNPAGLAMLEAVSLVAAQAKPLIEFVVPEHRDAFADLHRRVIGGESGVLEFEVIGLKGARRWLETHAAPLRGAAPGEVMLLGIARDITSNKLAADELQRFRAAMDISPDAIVLVDRASMRYIDVNQTICEMAGLTKQELLRLSPMDTTGQTRETLEREYDALIAGNDSAGNKVEGQGIRPDGSRIVVETRRRALRTDKGWVIVGISRDITERKAAEEKIVRLNRVYAVLSGINGAIVRIKEPEELFREVCRIAVAEGGFTLARVIDLDPDGRARIAATSESDASLFQRVIDEHNRDPVNSSSILALVFRSGEAVISNDVANDSRIPARAALTKAGNYALALLPLRTQERLTGVIVLRAPRAGAFDQDELLLLHELTGNISFALDTFAKEERLKTQAEERMRGDEALHHFRSAMDATSDAIYLVDRASMQFTHVNEVACRMQGLTREVLLSLGPEGVLGASRPELERVYDTMIESGVPAKPAELLRTRRDGSQAWVELRRHALPSGAGWTIVTLVRDITEQKQRDEVRRKAEWALLESERRFSDLLANVQLLSVMLDGTGRITYCNEYLLRLTGWRLEEVVGRDWFEVFVPADVADTKAIFATMLANLPEALSRENVIVTRSGERRLIRWNNSVLRSAGGEVTGTASIGEDITERKRGVEALLRFSAAMDATSDAIYLIDRASMSFIHVNEAACRMQGKTREELISRGPASELSSREELERIYDGLIASGVPAEPVVVLRTRGDGSQGWMEFRRHALPSAQGWTIVTLVRDITDQKARDESMRRFRAAMDISGDGVVLIDRVTLRYIDVNQTICEMIGRTREQMIGLTPMDIFSADRKTLEHDYDAIIADNDCPESLVEGLYRRADGTEFPIEARRHALRTGEGWLIVSTVRDITERKAAQAKIQRLSRVHAVLSGINTLIVRVTDRDELFREACRIAVDAGGFKMAWIGVADREAMMIVPIASAGAEAEFLDYIATRFSLRADSPSGKSMTARAIRDKKPVVCNDMSTAPDIVMAKQRMERGIASMVILPMVVSEVAVGVLSLYAGEKDYFDAEEMKLLTELAGDIAFAIDHIDKQARLDYQAYYDELTGLANRKLFLERVAQYIRSATAGGHGMAVFLVDLERFRNINETLGRQAGDTLLRKVAEWLSVNVGDPNLVARIGADHFAVVLPEVRTGGSVAHLIEKTMAAFLGHPFHLEDAVFRISCRVGAALFPGDGADADTLLRNAETALKKAKRRGEPYLLYKQKMSAQGAGKLTLENKLRLALENEEFVLHYQPKVSLLSGKLTSAEALIRWNDPLTGLVPPGHFIPILEETGLIHDVGRWALRKAIDDYLLWRAAGLPAVRIAVNVSPLQLRSREFIAEIQAVIGVDAHAADGLELEITESLIMEDVKHSIASLQAIRDMKVGIAIDDFGTGFSSLSYLAKLPVDTLKIDRSFVVEMMVGPDGLSLVSTIINLAHSLKLKVVAEGVEMEEQSRLLRLLGCDEMQGYLFSRPVPAAEFEARFLAVAVPEPQ